MHVTLVGCLQREYFAFFFLAFFAGGVGGGGVGVFAGLFLPCLFLLIVVVCLSCLFVNCYCSFTVLYKMSMYVTGIPFVMGQVAFYNTRF